MGEAIPPIEEAHVWNRRRYHGENCSLEYASPTCAAAYSMPPLFLRNGPPVFGATYPGRNPRGRRINFLNIRANASRPMFIATQHVMGREKNRQEASLRKSRDLGEAIARQRL